MVNHGSNTLESFYVGGTQIAQANLGNATVEGSLNITNNVNNQQLLSVNTSSNNINIGNFGNGTLGALPLVSTVATGANPDSVAVSNGYAYVVNSNSNTLESFSVSSTGVISSTPISTVSAITNYIGIATRDSD